MFSSCFSFLATTCASLAFSLLFATKSTVCATTFPVFANNGNANRPVPSDQQQKTSLVVGDEAPSTLVSSSSADLSSSMFTSGFMTHGDPSIITLLGQENAGNKNKNIKPLLAMTAAEDVIAKNRKDFHKAFGECVADSDEPDDRLFLKYLEECLFDRVFDTADKNEQRSQHQQMLSRVGSSKSATEPAFFPAKTSSEQPRSSSDSAAAMGRSSEEEDLAYFQLRDPEAEKFIDFLLQGDAGGVSDRVARQVKRRTTTTTTTTTPRSSSTSKSDIIVGEDRKRIRQKGIWGK